MSQQKEEEQKQIPGAPDRKRIEPPKTKEPKKSSFDKDLDDEIPF